MSSQRQKVKKECRGQIEGQERCEVWTSSRGRKSLIMKGDGMGLSHTNLMQQTSNII